MVIMCRKFVSVELIYSRMPKLPRDVHLEDKNLILDFFGYPSAPLSPIELKFCSPRHVELYVLRIIPLSKLQ